MKYSDKQRKQAIALQALIDSPTLTIAASRAGCTVRTLQTYMSEPDFSGSLMNAQQATLRETSRRLAAMSSCALGVLDEVLSDNTIAAGIRARSAEKILYASLRFSESVDLHAKLQQVESALGGTSETMQKDKA